MLGFRNIEDNTYNDIREKSLMQWLDDMEKHEDVAVRGGVKLAKEYFCYLKEENKRLKAESRHSSKPSTTITETPDKNCVMTVSTLPLFSTSV